MTFSDGSRLRVAVAAAPAMLSDVLRVLLEDHADVTILLAATTERFDIALTTADAPPVLADIVIDLDASSVEGGGIVRPTEPPAASRFDDLDEILRFVEGRASG